MYLYIKLEGYLINKQNDTSTNQRALKNDLVDALLVYETDYWGRMRLLLAARYCKYNMQQDSLISSTIILLLTCGIMERINSRFSTQSLTSLTFHTTNCHYLLQYQLYYSRQMPSIICMQLLLIVAIAVVVANISHVQAFTSVVSPSTSTHPSHSSRLYAKKKTKPRSSGGGGFGTSSSSSSPSKKKNKSSRDLISTLNDDNTPKQKNENKQTYVKSDQEQLLKELASKSEATVIGKAVSKCPEYNTPDMDTFWQMLPSLISTKFPSASDSELQRVADMVEFSLGVRGPEEAVILDPYRPHTELHAYMPGLGETTPFLDTNLLDLCQQLSDNYDVICKEYEALLEERFDRKGKDRFQSVTSMNCKYLKT